MSSLIEEVAARLGLTYSVKMTPLPMGAAAGVLEGQRVSCTWGERGSRVEAWFDPPLDLGLHVRSLGFVNLPSLGSRVFLGDSNWDEEVIATADDAARAAVLFAADARRAVLGLNAITSYLELSDTSVVTQVTVMDAEAVIQSLTHVARVAAVIASARRAVPVAGPLRAHAEILRVFASEHELELTESPLELRGDRDGVRLEAWYLRTGRNEFDVEVRATPLDAPEGFGLVVRRGSAIDRVKTFFGGQDIVVGDPVFDPAYLVRAEDEGRARGALDPDVRALLMDLAGRFEEVSLEGAAVTARTAVGRIRAEDLRMLLEAACTVSERVARAAAGVTRGAYR
ncbi:MAG: hypothetical protein ABJE95_25945 [Byssovorax sp.]